MSSRPSPLTVPVCIVVLVVVLVGAACAAPTVPPDPAPPAAPPIDRAERQAARRAVVTHRGVEVTFIETEDALHAVARSPVGVRGEELLFGADLYVRLPAAAPLLDTDAWLRVDLADPAQRRAVERHPVSLGLVALRTSVDDGAWRSVHVAPVRRPVPGDWIWLADLA